MPKEYIAEEVPAYLKEMQIVLTAGLLDEAAKQTLTLKQVIRKAKVSGMADIEIEKMLLRDLREGGQLFGNFRKQMKSTVKSGIEDSGRQEVRQSFLDVKLWSWLAIVDGKICPDCLDRHGWTAMTWEEWEAVGLPDSGNTICGQNCRCILTPAGSVKKEDGGLKRPVKVPPKPAKAVAKNKVDIKEQARSKRGIVKDVNNGDKAIEKYIDKLPENEKLNLNEAMKEYTVGGYHNINSKLRVDGYDLLDNYQQKIFNRLDKFLTNAPVYENISYRGLSISKKDNYKKIIENFTKKNNIISTKQFWSTSAKKDTALHFLSNSSDAIDIVFKIKGKKGVFINGLSEFSIEKEVLFNYKSKFKIVNVNKKIKTFADNTKNIRYNIEIEEIL